MPEYKPGAPLPAEPKKKKASLDEAIKGKKTFLSLTPILPGISALCSLLPVFETPVSWNEKGECVGVGLRFLWEFLPTQTLANQIFQGILFPLLFLASLLFSILALTSSLLPLELEGKADKRYVLSMAFLTLFEALLGVFGLSFNHLVLMGVGLVSALYCMGCLFLHYRKFTSY